MGRIEILTIGDELVEGRLVDTNAGTLSERLAGSGLRVAQHLSVGDDQAEIVRALREGAARCDAVLVSGGLGPTTDDLTAECAAHAFDRELVRFPEALEHVRCFFASRGRRMSPNNEKQADLPGGSEVLPNPQGTAVGFCVHAHGCRLYFMPGVPRELVAMFSDHILPDLLSFLPAAPPHVATIKVFGKGESDVAQTLDGLGQQLPIRDRLTIQYRASFPEIHVRLVVDGQPGPEGEEALQALVEECTSRLAKYVFAVGGQTLATTFADAVVADARTSNAQIATADGVTGGLLAQMVGSVAGASDVFRGGVVAPTPDALPSLLGAPTAAGDLSAAAIEEVAGATRERLGATHAVAVSGTEPAADSAGEVWIGVAGPHSVSSRNLSYPIDRERFLTLAAYSALLMLRRTLRETGPAPSE